VRHVISTMKSHGISQLPILAEDGALRGIVAEVDVLRHLVSGEGHLDGTISPIIESDYATVTADTKIELLQSVLADAKVALVIEGERLVGIVSKIDVIDYLAKRAAA
jgi:cystathionine beta-synthase